MEDNEIIQLYWDRNQSAIERTKEKYEKYLTSISWHVLRDREDVEECMNDTYLKAWNSMPEQWPEFFRAFLGAIVRNLSLDCYRRKSSKKRGGGELTCILEELRDCTGGGEPEQELENEIIAGALNQFLKKMDQESRVIFVRRYWYMDSVKEIAKRLGVGESRIKSNLFRTRKKLREFLEKEGIEL